MLQIVNKAHNFRAIEINAKKIIYNQGEKINEIYYINFGIVRIVRYYFGYEKIEYRGSGDFIGYFKGDNNISDSTAIAQTFTNLTAYPNIYKNMPEKLERAIIGFMVREHKENQITLKNSDYSYEARVANAILRLALKFGVDDGKQITVLIKLNNMIIAKIINMHHTGVQKVTVKLKREKIINSNMTIIDKIKINEFINSANIDRLGRIGIYAR